MDNIYLKREEGNEPFFKEEEIRLLLSDEFKLVDIQTNTTGNVETLVVTCEKYPELSSSDPFSKAVSLHIDLENNGYWLDPRFFEEEELFIDHVLPDLMTDLELEYNEEMM